MLCGDEVAVVVADFGREVSKVGFAGQDCPRWVNRTECGLDRNDGTLQLEETKLRTPRSNFEIVNPLTGMPEINWDWVEAAFKTSVTEHMKLDLADMPILVAESCFTASKDKEKLVELMFERLETPACFIASDAMLNSFCAGRPTSLVVDVGGGGIQVTPVVDGYTLRNAVMSTNRGGRWLEDQIAAYLASQQISVTPRYELRGLPEAVQIANSFRQACVRDVLRDIKHTVLRVPEKPLQEADHETFVSTAVAAEATQYELPDGTTIENTYELVAIAEQLFQSPNAGQQLKRPKPSAFLPAHAQPIETDENIDSLQELIYASVGRSDVDTRRELLNTITFCGGGSLLPGLGQRLQEELGAMMPTGYRVKVNMMLPIERQFGTWIGGSILGTCGAFQQMWLSRQEFEDHGMRLLHERFCH